MRRRRNNSMRRGSVYLAVLGTALIVSILAFSSLALQRIQNRMLSSAADIRQAQLNAESALELGLLAIRNDDDWRANNASGQWFAHRNLGAGDCTLSVVDPLDGNLADNSLDPIIITGTGTAGRATQRVVRTIDSFVKPLGCLRSSVAAGGGISLSGASLRAADSGRVTANSLAATGSAVFGNVNATSITGSSYNGVNQQVAADELPQMPNWSTVFDYYRNNGTELVLTSLPTTISIARNTTFESGTTYWTGTPTGVPTASISQSNNRIRSGSYSLRVTSRAAWTAGAAQYIDGNAKGGQSYYIETWIYSDTVLPRYYRLRVTTKGTQSSESSVDGASTLVLGYTWTRISATLTAPSWTGDLEYAFVKVAGGDATSTADFYMDDVTILENTSGRFIYRRVIGPGVNPFGASNPLGLYWINCAGNKLIIERSRIKGTLLVINPGSGSCIGAGPISWTPSVPGYPALLVTADTAANADFTIAATNRTLSEAEDQVNYNPAGVSHANFGTDNDMADNYPSEIQGLVVVQDDLTFQNDTVVRGSVIAGDAITSSGGALEVVYRPDALFSPPPGFAGSPTQLARPLSIRKQVIP